jgi:predicted anti-sigma-YlaC factor YlaD
MTCDDAKHKLDEYVDGDLVAAEVHELELHLASCSSCRDEERELRSLLAQAAALPRQVRPERDLWPEIAEEIGRPRRVLGFPVRTAAWGGGLAAAAALVVAILAGRGPTPADPAFRATDDDPSRAPAYAAASPEAELREAEADYERATKALLAALEAHRDQLAPLTLESVEKNLAVIDRAVSEVRAALLRDPGNPELTRMLAATQRKKVDVLQRVVKLSASRL